MKKTLFIALALLMGIASLHAEGNSGDGKFRVSETGYVKFAKGNMSYSSNKQFSLLNYYETRKTYNEAIAKDFSGTWDLFGWGTSGYNSVQPWESSESASKYASEVGNNIDIASSSFMEYDWGMHNKIAGDAAAHFYCPTADEWNYILNERPNAENLRALATITIGGSPTGLILLPDNWSTPLDFVINTKGTEYSDNKFASSQWDILEKCGAIFLPSAGSRYGAGSGSYTTMATGIYWTGTSGSNQNVAVAVLLGNKPELQERNRAYGLAVRLIESQIYGCKTVKGEETKEDKTIEEYEWNGRKLTKSGDYTYTFLHVRNDHGDEVDSIATLHLRMKDWTGIDNVPTTKQTKVQKVVRDGQLYIIRDDKTFNAAGIQVK